MREITVKGSYRGEKSPDWTKIAIEISGKHQDYQMAIDDIKQRTAILREDLNAIGFDTKDIKTTQFKVETVYQLIDRTRVFDGYLAKHDLKIEFKLEQKKLSEVIMTLSQSKAKPNFDLAFTLEDNEKFKNKLIVGATKEAEARAIVIADSLGIKLGDITEVKYEDEQFELGSFRLDQPIALAKVEMDIHPSEVTATQSVLITWEIESIYTKR